MRSEHLLGSIWKGDVVADDGEGVQEFLAAFQSIIPVQTLPLVLSGGLDRPTVLTDDVELMPALPLGDILAEELDIDVPYGSLVVILPARTQAQARAHAAKDLGFAVAETLCVAQSQLRLPVESETDSLYMMAHSAVHTGASLPVRKLGIDAPMFNLGMGQSLANHWRGDRSMHSVDHKMFTRPDFLWHPKLRAYLKELDACFTSPDPIGLPCDLLKVSDAHLDVVEWVALLEQAVRKVLPVPRASAHGAVPRSGIMSRFNLQ